MKVKVKVEVFNFFERLLPMLLAIDKAIIRGKYSIQTQEQIKKKEKEKTSYIV